jgi:hypothetical protein
MLDYCSSRSEVSIKNRMKQAYNRWHSESIFNLSESTGRRIQPVYSPEAHTCLLVQFRLLFADKKHTRAHLKGVELSCHPVQRNCLHDRTKPINKFYDHSVMSILTMILTSLSWRSGMRTPKDLATLFAKRRRASMDLLDSHRSRQFASSCNDMHEER